ncbi:MAG TPA: hypothetical protein VD902_03975 [Symbiobacteriaceae bacterium]|nr:hypothetical protein [Symbiobacteriaceae bacterium]
MRSAQSLTAAVALILALTLGACGGGGGGGGGGQQKSPEKKEQNGFKKNGGKKQKEEDPVKKSAGKMQSKLADMRESVKAGDMKEAQRLSRETDAEWERIEEQMEHRNPELTNRIKWQLVKILAGVQLTPGNTEGLDQEMETLDTDLDELRQTKGKEPKQEKVDVETGVSAMRHNLSELKKAIESGDSAKAQEKAKATEKDWHKFEDQVKEKDKDATEKVEDSLHTILAGVKEFPMDKKKLNEEIDKLDKTLTGLTK